MIRPVRLPVLRCIALSLLTHWVGTAGAVGLGPIRVLSSLGQPLQAQIPLIGNDSAELTSTCVKTRLQSADGAALGIATVAVSHTPRGDAIVLSTRQAINEPAIMIQVNIACGPLVNRDFSILLDPIGMMPVLPETATRALTESEIASRSSVPTSPRRRNRTNSDASESGGEPRPRRIVAPDSSSTAADTRAPLASPRATSKLAAPRKNILTLSNEGFTDAELASMGQLKLSSTMSETALPVDAAQREGLLAARNLFAQMLRGDDPAQIVQTERAASVQQMAALQKQIATINRERAAERAAMEDLKKNSLSLPWVLGLLGVLLLSLIGAGLLAWRLLVSKKQTASAWDVALTRQEPQQGGHTVVGAEPAVAPSRVAPASVVAGMAVGAAATIAVTKKSGIQHVGTDFGHNLAATKKSAPQVPEISEPAASRDDDATPQPAPVVRPDLDFTSAKPIASTAKQISSIDQNEALHFYSSKVEHLKVEEISDVMQEAEFWMSLNDPHRAMEILEPYANVDVPDSPMPWLYLLDLYRGTDEQLKYTLLQEKAARIFNVRIALWDEDADLMDGRTLEDFPHVVTQICNLWETNEIFAYLESLIFDKREGIRGGFDLSVYQEIMMLLTMVRSYGRDRAPSMFSGTDNNQLAIE